jgi:hypothetical protein
VVGTLCAAHIRHPSVAGLTARNWHLHICVVVILFTPESNMLIQNLNYLKTAVEVLESGQVTEANTVKILKIMSEICAMNVQKMTQILVDDKSPKCYN